MRSDARLEQLCLLMRQFGERLREPVSVYFTDGATAVIHGFRESTVDVDVTFHPERDEVFHLIRSLKEGLNINIEIASPAHFIPELEGTSERHVFIEQQGVVGFYHYDPYMQLLSKIERGWPVDVLDANALATHVDLNKLLELFNRAKERFERYPAVDVAALEVKLRNFIADVSA